MRVLFVCLGNICRSPLAHGVFEAVAHKQGLDIEVDSAGTGAWHIGNPPDRRSIAVAAKHGIDISGQRARKLAEDDFDRFDLILGMDRSNVDNINAKRRGSSRAHVDLFLDYAISQTRDVPDPYYGGDDGFEDVCRMIRAGAESLGTRLGGGMDKPPRS
ncbi:MAG: low molecular weight protein-tyrosine-phosphatase [Pseudomonadota bacterium]